MSDHVLLHLSNELVKRDKMRGLSSSFSLFCNEFVMDAIAFLEDLFTTSGLSIL